MDWDLTYEWVVCPPKVKLFTFTYFHSVFPHLVSSMNNRNLKNLIALPRLGSSVGHPHTPPLPSPYRTRRSYNKCNKYNSWILKSLNCLYVYHVTLVCYNNPLKEVLRKHKDVRNVCLRNWLKQNLIEKSAQTYPLVEILNLYHSGGPLFPSVRMTNNVIY